MSSYETEGLLEAFAAEPDITQGRPTYPDEFLVAVVRAYHEQGTSLRAITKVLNGRGELTAKGLEFTSGPVHSLLHSDRAKRLAKENGITLRRDA